MLEIRNNPFKSVAIYPQDGLGLGDFALAAAFAENFFTREKLCHHQILLVSDKPQGFDLFNYREFTIISTRDLRNRCHEIALLVIAPVTLTYPSFSDLRIPTAGFQEYGFRKTDWNRHIEGWARPATLGLGQDELGILIDPDLVEWEPSSSLECLKRLAGLPPGLQKAILEEPYSHQTIESFAKYKNLYVGYAYYPGCQEAFIGALSRATDKEIVVVMPNCKWEFFKNSESLEVVAYDWQNDLHEIIKEPLSPRRIRIITGEIPHWHLKNIRMAAEKETIATGDGSLSETICLGNNFVYEVSSHKERLAQDVQELYGPDSIVRQNVCSVDISKVWASRRNQPQLLPPRDQIVQRYNAWPRIVRFIDALLLMSRQAQYPLSFNSHSIPYNQVIFVSTGAICDLRIDDTGESELSDLQDSTFETEIVSPGLYSLVRKPKNLHPFNSAPAPLQRQNRNYFQTITNLFLNFCALANKIIVVFQNLAKGT